MAVNDTRNTAFYSGWDIDKLVTNGQTSVSLSGFNDTKQIVDLSQYGFSDPPTVMALINFGDGLWYLSGGRFPSSVLIQFTNNQVYARCISSAINITVKYWVFRPGIV